MFVEVKHDLHVHVGDLNNASDVTFLRKNRIKAMLSVVHGGMNEYSDVVNAVNSVGIAHQHIDLGDAPEWSLIPHFDTIRTFIDSYQCVLVHCVSGISRSTSCVLVHMIMNGSRLDDAYLKILAVYPKASPAPWFFAELRALDSAHGVFPRHDSLDAPLFLRAAAVGVPQLSYSNCSCPPIRCRKCRSSIIRACLPFGSVNRTSLLLAQTADYNADDESLKCKKCESKIGTLNLATWIDGVNAGIGTVYVYQIHASKVDFPLGVVWPKPHPAVKLEVATS